MCHSKIFLSHFLDDKCTFTIVLNCNLFYHCIILILLKLLCIVFREYIIGMFFKIITNIVNSICCNHLIIV